MAKYATGKYAKAISDRSGLELKDFSKLEKRLKEKGYQPGEYAMGGSVGKPMGAGGK